MKYLRIYLISLCAFSLLTTNCEKGNDPGPERFPELRNAYLEDASVLKELYTDANEQYIKFQIKDSETEYLIFKSDITTYTIDSEGKTISKNRYSSDTFNPISIDWNEFRFEWGYVINNMPDGYVVQIRQNNSEYYRKIEFYFSIVDSALANNFGNGTYYPYTDYCEFTIIQPPKEQSRFMVRIKYNGVEYSSFASVCDDGSLNYENKDFRELIMTLGRKDTESFILSDGILQIYDSERSEAKQLRKALAPASNASRPFRSVAFGTTTGYGNPYEQLVNNSLGYFIAYVNNGFRGRYMAYNLTQGLYDCFDVQKTGDINFNDNISSLFVYTPLSVTDASAVLTIWEDSDYNHGDGNRTKHKISIVANPGNPVTLANLSSLPLIGSSGNWNDKISSLSFHFTDRIYQDTNY